MHEPVKVEVEGASPLEAGCCRVIAEAGVNHNNSIDQAIELARRASEAGAWAVKYQLYTASLARRSSPKYWTDEIGTASQHEAFDRTSKLRYEDYEDVAQACADLGIVFFATPFDRAAVDALEAMSAPLYKIASGDITHRPLLEYIAETGKPMLLSTGASTPGEIEQALDWIGCGPERVVPLTCTLTYPTPDEDGNFARMETMRERFAPHLIGFSDHTLGPAGAWMAAALGAVCIEKHYTLDKTLPDVPDHAMSVEPEELAEMVRACDRAAVLRGRASIEVVSSEEPARLNARRSIVAARRIDEGSVLESDDIDFRRPGDGLSPAEIDSVLGKRAARTIEEDHPLSLDDVR